MHTITISPRFSETDALGHITNTAVPVWFEEGRQAVFTAVHPSLKLSEWPLIAARVAVDFIAQIHIGNNVIIHTGVSKLGNSSITVHHEAWQNDKIVARGEAVLVYFDYHTNKSRPLPDDVRERLQPLLIST